MSDVKCIAVASGRGNVGKTTLVSALALTLSRTKRVLIIDLERVLSIYTSVWNRDAPGTASFLLGEDVKPRQVLPNLHIFSGDTRLYTDEITRLGIDALAQRLKGLPYDVILCDCTSKAGHLERLAFHASHDVLVALNADPMALVDAGQLIKDVFEAQARHELQQFRLTFVLGRLNERNSLDRQMPGILDALWPQIPVFKVRNDVTLARSMLSLIYNRLDRQFKHESEDISAIVKYLYEPNYPPGQATLFGRTH